MEPVKGKNQKVKGQAGEDNVDDWQLFIPMDLSEFFLQLQKEDIAYLKFILESYEGVGIVRTIDQKKGIVVLLVAKDFKATAESILASLHREISFIEVPRPHDVGDDWLFREITEEETLS